MSKEKNLIENLSGYLRFQRTRYSGNITCPETPHFESSQCTEKFEKMLRRSDVYLEYGSGGSSVLAASLGKKAFSVDSDKVFLNQVRKTIEKCNFDNTENIKLIYANIGLTREWGVPLFTKLSPRRLMKWRQYVMAPWQSVHAEGLKPDLVLIDGRFRVACALESFKNLGTVKNAHVIFDDYFLRDYYSVVEQFGEIEEKIGRMAIFKPKEIDANEINKALMEYSTDWR